MVPKNGVWRDYGVGAQVSLQELNSSSKVLADAFAALGCPNKDEWEFYMTHPTQEARKERVGLIRALMACCLFALHQPPYFFWSGKGATHPS
jgi:hypothetical protein